MDKDTRQFLRAMDQLTGVLQGINEELHEMKKMYSLDVMLRHDLKEFATEADKETERERRLKELEQERLNLLKNHKRGFKHGS